MVTFVAQFISKAAAEASNARDKEIAALTRDVTAAAEKQRIGREYKAAHPLPRVTLSQVADHVEHVRQVAGPDHVGLGGDYDGNEDWPEGMEDVTSYPKLFAELARRGWSDEDLGKLASGNILPLHEGRVVAVARHQLVVDAGLHDGAVLEDHHRVGVDHGGKTVGDHEGGAALEQQLERFLHLRLRLRVQG